MHFLDFNAFYLSASKKNEQLEYWTILKWPAILGHFKIVWLFESFVFLARASQQPYKQVNVLDNRSLKRS